MKKKEKYTPTTNQEKEEQTIKMNFKLEDRSLLNQLQMIIREKVSANHDLKKRFTKLSEEIDFYNNFVSSDNSEINDLFDLNLKSFEDYQYTHRMLRKNNSTSECIKQITNEIDKKQKALIEMKQKMLTVHRRLNQLETENFLEKSIKNNESKFKECA